MSHVDIFVFLCLSEVIILGASNTNDILLNNQTVTTVVIGNSNAKETIVIGYMMDQLAPPYRIGAISMAIQDGQTNGLLRGYNFRYDLSFSCCNIFIYIHVSIMERAQFTVF